MASRKKEISKKEVRHTAWLARIELSKEEEVFTEQLNKILEYFRRIDEVNTDDVEPTHHVLDLANIFRSDEVKPSSPDAILSGVPQSKDRWVKAPRIA